MALVLETGRTVASRYRLDRLLGQGGMGEVWAATHSVTRRSVAMKFVKGTAHTRPELRRRFMREARAASAVQHPNVVEVFDVFELDAETPVMVMELLSGETLGKKLAREGQLELDEALAVLVPAVSAVGSAHALGVIHRDLKPENLFLARSTISAESPTIVKVLDFGIAKLSSEMSGETGVTETGTTLGTPCYMAPEQAMAERELDHRVDVWSFGVILYETLSGARPIEGDTVGQVVKHLMTTGITPLERVMPGLPAPLTTLVARMLSRERSRRPEDLREVFEVLQKLTAVRAPSFGAPGSQAPPAGALVLDGTAPVLDGTALVLDGGARVLDGAASQIDPAGTTVRVDTAGPHAVSSRVKRRSQSSWLFAGAAASALAGGVLVYALTRPAAETAPASEGSAAAAGPPAGPAETARPALAVPSSPSPARSAVAIPVEPSSASATRATAQARKRGVQPGSSTTASAPAPSASVHAQAPQPTRPAASSTAGRRPSSGGLAEKPPF